MTVLVPTGKIAGALLVTVTAPQLSATVGFPMATLVAPHIPGEAETVTSVGQEIVGGWLSVTKIGRASGRERVWISVVAGSLKKKKGGKMGGGLVVKATAHHLSGT